MTRLAARNTSKFLGPANKGFEDLDFVYFSELLSPPHTKSPIIRAVAVLSCHCQARVITEKDGKEAMPDESAPAKPSAVEVFKTDRIT